MRCIQDSSFGPVSTCRTYDFTLYFEQTIFSFFPDVVFVFLTFFRLWFLHREPNKLQSTGWPLLSTKMVSGLLVVAINVASLIYYLDAHKQNVVFVWMPAPPTQLGCTILLVLVIVMEHFRSRAPSVLVVCYSFLKGIYSALALRSHHRLGTTSGISVSLVFSTASYLSLMCVELVEKRKLLREKTLSAVTTSSFLSRSIYIWLIPLLWTGRKHTLSIEDCDIIPDEFYAQPTRLKLETALMRTRVTSCYLYKGFMRAFGLQFLSPVVPRTILLLATFAQPLLVTQMITFVSTPALPATQGWALVGGFVCVYMLIALSTSLYWEKVFQATVTFRAALVGAIYSKTLKLSSTSSRSLGGGVASTYMSVDVERVCVGAEYFHEAWASVFSIALSIILLYRQTSWPAFLPLAVTVVLIVAAIFFGRRVNFQQAAWLAATDKRVKFMSSVIHNILPIKCAHYETFLAQRAAHLRGEEMEMAKRFYKYSAITGAMSNSAGTFCILTVLIHYAASAVHKQPTAPDINNLFTIITIVNLLSGPLTFIGQILPELAAANASLSRIQKYLLLDEKGRGFSDEVEQKVSHEGPPHESILMNKMGTPKTVIMDAASFSWKPDTSPCLTNITIRLDEPTLYICVGSVASGKSLLLLSILGESTQVCGRFVGPQDRIAYAPQEALIIPGTICENILFGQSYHAERYSRVLEACALTKDISMLPAGDGTLLGEKGCRLSGGQKQRIALARAVYADAPWTLLDDPFSALDAATEAHIFMSLFGPGGLLYGKAVLLATHNVSHLGAASHVIVLKDGQIQTQGAPTEIDEHCHTLLVEKHTQLRKQSRAESENSTEGETAVPSQSEHETEEQPIAKSSLGLTPYLFFLRMMTWKNAVFCFFLLVLLSGARIGLQLYFRAWTVSDGRHLGRWIGGYAGLSFSALLATAFTIWQYCMVITDVSGRAIHREEVKGLLEVAPSYFLSTPAGRIINRFSQDIFCIDLLFPIGCFNALVRGVLLFGTLAFIFIPVPLLSLSLIPLGLVYYFSLVLYLRTSKQLQHLEAGSKSPLYTTFSATLSGLETIRALRVESHFQDQNDVYLNRSQVPFFNRFGTLRFLRTVLALISGALAICLAAATVKLRNSIDPSILGLALSNMTELLQLLSSLCSSLALIENGSIAISRIHEIISLPKEEHMTVSAPAFLANIWPSVGTIVFQDVHMRYKTDFDPVLRGISFRVGAGQKIGICGRSGSGKSSIVLALYRALDRSLVDGTIKIDGVDINTIPLSLLRRSLSLVAQDPFLWNSSIRDNLDPENELTDDLIWLALKKVGIHDAIAFLPDKLESVLEDKGSFSKGQLQLLCFVRVLLRKRKIVVLDEATSSLDSDTDEKMKEVIRTELANCTVIAVAHRIATIVDFDWILVMDDGRLVENGRPQDLLAQPDSHFARFASSQGIRW